MVELEEPDKGRAWLIAFSACIINMILSGLSRMIGILYVAVLDTYHVTRQEATLPFTVRNAIRMLSGPLVGIIGTRFGIRTVTFFGGLMAAAGAALCSVAPNISWLAVCWGGIHGMGFAFANTLFQVVVNQYFQKYRATASGIALSGACVGSLVFPIMIEAILDKYALSGGFLILGGIVMHVLPPALLLSVPQWVKYPEAYARLWALKNAASASSDTVVSVDDSAAKLEEDEPEEKAERELARTTSLSNCPIESIDVCKVSCKNFNKQRQSGVFGPVVGLVRNRADTDENVVCTGYRKKCYYPQETTIPQKESSDSSNSSSGVYSISSQVDEKSNNKTNSEKPVLEAANTKIRAKNQSTQSISQSIKSIAALYTNPVYVLISFCMSTYILIFIPILTVIVDYSIDKGIPESNGKYLINAMAIGDLAGRLCFGWVTDKKLMTIPAFMTLVLVLEGIFIALFPFAMTLTSFMVLLILYGMTAGAILVLFPVLVLQYVDYSSQSVAMACVGFLSGIVSFAIPPMIGHFRDKVGSYDGMFYLTGGISVLSGGLWLLEPIVNRDEFVSRERLRTISIGEVSLTIKIPPPEHQQETSIYKGTIKLFRDPMFHMISLSLAAFNMLFDPALTVIVDYLIDKSVTEEIAKYFTSYLFLWETCWEGYVSVG
ncbi:Monocarboxylate transporter 9 like protein [Argiope bruennichi]|uniref:Monocarboxylate transporter 9 like protein n=1 Tax=Argiope bruennichi TaxID=94029 RepID=A0A8T0EX36_ARGBR|nr:Monocarboxylate transporter 9 like protein [Argiope bruennichi]